MGLLAKLASLFVSPKPKNGGSAGRIDHEEFTPLRPPQLWTWPMIQKMNADHEIHNFIMSSTLTDSLMRDDEIAGLIQSRLLGTKGLPFRIEPEDQRLLDEWPTLFPENTQSEVLFWTLHMGFCVCELRNWKSGVPTLKVWHPSHVQYDDTLKRFRVTTKEHGILTVEPGDGKWVVFTSWLEERPWMAGLIRAVGLLMVIRQATLADWSRNSKVHGSASKVLKAKAQMSEVEDVQLAIAALRKMVSDSTIVLPDNCELFLLEPKIASWQVFKELRRAVEEALMILYLGQNLTTKVTGGSHAAAKVHQQVRQDFLMGDTRILIPITQKQVIFPFLQYQRGIQDLKQAPSAVWDATPPEDVLRAAEVRLKNAQAMNYAAQAWLGFKKGLLNVEPQKFGETFMIPIVEGKPLLPPPDPPKDGETPPNGPREDRPDKKKDGEEITTLRKPYSLALAASPSSMGPTLFHWGRDPFIGGQLTVDRLNQGASLDAVEAIGQEVVGSILDEIKACRDEQDPYGALKARLAEMLPRMDPQRLTWILNDAMSLAVATGSFAARKEAGGG